MSNAKVEVYKTEETLIDHSLEPLNPHPVFPQWSIHDVYPYQFMGNVRCRLVKKKFTMAYLENEFLKICVAPDLGGRVWFIYDKVSKRHAVNHSSEVVTYGGGFGLNYTCAGLEVNYPLAHSCPTSRKREYKIFENPDGSASVIISEYEQIWRTRWSLKYTLRPGKSFLEQTVRIYNRSLHDSRYMYWSNFGFSVNDDTQFIFPEKAGAMHGNENQEFSWPIWKQADLSYWKNVIEPLGLYMLDAREPYFGYYDHGANYGFVHYADLSDLPGKKYWSWGSTFVGRVLNANGCVRGGSPYGEMQAGRIAIQEHLDRMPPETEAEWTEYWYPVRNTQGFDGVGKDAALSLKTSKSTAGTELLVKTMGSGTFPDARLTITCGNKKVAERNLSLNPISAVVSKFLFRRKPGEGEALSAEVVNRKNGELIVKADLRKTSERDSWSEILSVSKDVKPKSAEEIFMEGERLARDWGNNDPYPIYGEALKIDPGLSSANLEMGKICVSRGTYDSAIEHFKKARERNPENLDTCYSLGIALLLSERPEEASHCLELSSRYDFENRSRTRLAEIKIRENDFHHALKYLNKITESAPRLTRPMTLKAICLRLLGKTGEARATIRKALEVDSADPFPQLEEMFLEKTLNKKNMGPLILQLRGYEPPYLEAVLDYGNLHLYRDALELLEFFPDKGPLAMFYQAFLEYKTGKPSYKKSLETACLLSPVNHCVWQLEMIPVLEWAKEVMPDNPRIYHHLGNLFVARGQLEKGVSMWQKAKTLKDTNYLLYSNLGYYETNVNKNSSSALGCFRKAHELDPDDPYVKIEIFNLLTGSGRKKEAVKFMEDNLNSVKTHSKLAYLLMNEYVSEGHYRKFDNLVPELSFSGNWAISGPQAVWTARYANEAMDVMTRGEYEKAIKLFNKSLRVPDRLGICSTTEGEQERIFYHIGRCHEKMGRLGQAKEVWEKAVKIDREYAWEIGYFYSTWIQRYFKALCLEKLGRKSETIMIFDGMELMAKRQELPETGRKYLMELVMKGRFAREGEKDPYRKKTEKVATTVEL
ncbi:MAG: DUF5107 domain-containing protein [Candidatus Omnitrophota bacterium]